MTRVAIIGGGIGGLTAANALSRAGIDTAVYEAAGELGEIGAGVALHPNAMKVLRAIGVEDGVRTVAGRSQWQVMRNWKTGRVIGRTSRQQQEASFGIPGATVHRADLLDVLAHALPAGLVTLGKRCTQVRPDGDVAVARFADGSEIEADVIVGADGIHSPVRACLFGPDDPRFTGKICYRSVVPARAVRGERPGTDGAQWPRAEGAQWPRAEGAQWLGPHGTIVLYPLRGEELINVVCHYDDASYRHESWIAECRPEEVLERYAGWHESLLALFAAAGTCTSGRCTIATRSRGGRAAGSPSWATPRIRCSPTSGRVPARRSRTGRFWPRRSRRKPPTRSRAWPATSARAGRGRAGWCSPPASGG
jgi:salicylate hydroxylase